jgi:hypothetical protein
VERFVKYRSPLSTLSLNWATRNTQYFNGR